jgi:hypothetical protein
MNRRKFNILIALTLLFLAISGSLMAQNEPKPANSNVNGNPAFFLETSVSQPDKESRTSEFLLLTPELSFFPQKISQKDLLIIIRKNNETASKINYTITGGTTTITGEFKGSKAEMKAYVDLATGLKNETGLQKISLIIKDINGITLATTDIPLVTID